MNQENNFNQNNLNENSSNSLNINFESQSNKINNDFYGANNYNASSDSETIQNNNLDQNVQSDDIDTFVGHNNQLQDNNINSNYNRNNSVLLHEPKKRFNFKLIGIVFVVLILFISVFVIINKKLFNSDKNNINRNSSVSNNKKIQVTIDGNRIEFPCSLKDILTKTDYGISIGIGNDYESNNVRYGVLGESNGPFQNTLDSTHKIILSKGNEYFTVITAEHKGIRIIDQQVIGFEVAPNNIDHISSSNVDIKLLGKYGINSSASSKEVNEAIKSAIGVEPFINGTNSLTYMDKKIVDYFNIEWNDDKINNIYLRFNSDYSNYKIPKYDSNNVVDNLTFSFANKQNIKFPTDLSSLGNKTNIYVDYKISTDQMKNNLTYAFDADYQASITINNTWVTGKPVSYDTIISKLGIPISETRHKDSRWSGDIIGLTYITDDTFFWLLIRGGTLSYVSYSNISN